MAKNRKNLAAEIRFGPVLKVVLLCTLIGGAAIGYVWQKNQIDRLGQQRLKRERQLASLQAENRMLSDQISFLRSPVMLDRRVKELNLGLVPAQPAQVVRLLETPARADQTVPRQFAQGKAADPTQ